MPLYNMDVRIVVTARVEASSEEEALARFSDDFGAEPGEMLEFDGPLPPILGVDSVIDTAFTSEGVILDSIEEALV